MIIMETPIITNDTLVTGRNYANVIYEDRNNNGIVFSVANHYGNVTVKVQSEGDHPSTRRARARKALRKVLGDKWEIHQYFGATLMTHQNSNGERYGALHAYSAVKIG